MSTRRSHPAAVVDVKAAASRRRQGGAEAASSLRTGRQRPRPAADKDSGERGPAADEEAVAETAPRRGQGQGRRGPAVNEEAVAEAVVLLRTMMVEAASRRG